MRMGEYAAQQIIIHSRAIVMDGIRKSAKRIRGFSVRSSINKKPTHAMIERRKQNRTGEVHQPQLGPRLKAMSVATYRNHSKSFEKTLEGFRYRVTAELNRSGKPFPTAGEGKQYP